ncbi:MAG: SDR family oxidoreductase [Candidatus Lokiarchaeia archaeon]
MTNILVLGINGMLGSMVFEYLKENPDFNVYGTVRNPKFKKENAFLFDANDILQLERNEFINLKINYIINCIGITKPFSKDDDPAGVIRAIKINSDFPWELAKYAKKYNVKILQIGTDCVYSGKKGLYVENDIHDPLDVYGKSKSLGEVFDKTTLIIRSSIIGPEFKNESTFLFEWFINQPEGSTIGGYEHHIWNGITTLQFAQICEKIITTNSFDELVSISYVHHFIPNSSVNKYELMNIFNDVFEKNLTIDRINKPDQRIDRTLSTEYNELDKIFDKKNMKEAIQNLKNYMDRKK